MTDKPREKKKGGWAAIVWALGAVMLLVVLYVASIGPVAASGHAVDWEHRIEVAYAPVCICVRMWPALARPINSYIEACDRDDEWIELDHKLGALTNTGDGVW